MSWSDEMIVLLKTHWGSGKSAAEIAQLLGPSMTRNAVIGKAHRMGLSGTRSGPTKATRFVKPEPDPAATILNLTDRMCRWPIGDPKQAGFRFCAKGVSSTLPYCHEHARLAYQHPNSKRRDEEPAADVA